MVLWNWRLIIKASKLLCLPYFQLKYMLQWQLSIMIMCFQHRDMFAVCVVAVGCLLSMSHSVPLACVDSIRPLGELDPHHLEGRWALVAGSMTDPADLEYFKRRDSSSINFSNTSMTTNISYTPGVRSGGKCRIQSYSVSLEGSVLTFDVRHQVNLTLTFLYTPCHDCVLIRFDDKSEKLLRLYFFSRRRELNQQEMEAFRAQVECLSLPPPAVMDRTKEICLEQGISD